MHIVQLKDMGVEGAGVAEGAVGEEVEEGAGVHPWAYCWAMVLHQR